MKEEQVPVTTPSNDPAAPVAWTSSLAPEYQTLPTFSKFKDVNDLAKSYVNLEKLVGVEKIPMPKDEKDEAGWSTVFSRLGRPESPEKYDVKVNLSEGLKIPDEIMVSLKDRAHKLGYSNKQLQGIVDHWTEVENNAFAQRLEADKQSEINAETGLRKKLGANFDVAKKNVEAFIRNFVAPDEQENFMTQARKNPAMFEAFFNASKTMGEDTLKGSRGAIGMTPADAELEYKKILSDFKGPYYTAGHPEHDMALKRVHDLLMYMQGPQEKANA